MKIQYQMLQRAYNQQLNPNTWCNGNDNQLHISINNINQIMAKINQVVRKSQQSLKTDDNLPTFVTQENLLTENIQFEDSESTKNSQGRINNMKIPLHQLHKKNKLSTVMEESQSQSGRTNGHNLTPRQPATQNNNKTSSKKQFGLSFTKINSLQQNKINNANQLQDQNRKPKKITGIRKTSNSKILENILLEKNMQNYQRKTLRQQNYKQQQNQKIKEVIQCKQMPKSKENLRKSFHRYTKTQSMANIKCNKLFQNLFYKKKDIGLVVQQQTKRSIERNKKGLSVLSKCTIRSQQDEKTAYNVQVTYENKIKTTNRTRSTQKKPTKINNSISVKKKTIHPFLLPKKSCQLDKKIQNKSKNCLSRTNIRQFFVSKRINR